MINNLDIAANRPPTSDLGRALRDAQWWANLPFAQRIIYVVRETNGLLALRDEATGSGTVVAAVSPDPFYMSGQREEWRERFMLMGDRRY